MTNRGRYDSELRAIEADVLAMGQTVVDMVGLAVRVAIEDDPSLVEGVTEREKRVDLMEQEITHRSILLLGLQNPVAKDLLQLSRALAIVGELEKVGDEATKLAVRLQKLGVEFPYEMQDLLKETAKQAQANVQAGLRLFCDYRREDADAIIAQDDVVDQSYKASRNMILAKMKEDPNNLRQFLRCIEVFHALEHVSDHAADIAKRIVIVNERYARGASAS